jgi:hypothetical protein
LTHFAASQRRLTVEERLALSSRSSPVPPFLRRCRSTSLCGGANRRCGARLTDVEIAGLGDPCWLISREGEAIRDVGP